MAGADVNIVIGAQDRASQVLNGVGSAVGQLQSGMKMLGPATLVVGSALAGATAAFVAFSKASEVVLERAKQIDELAKASARLGESVGDLQAFQFALGEVAGVDAGTAQQALAELRKSIGEALQGDQGKIDILAQLGLDAASLSQGGPVQAFEQIKTAIGGIENASQRAAVAEKLLGGEARKLMGLLSDQSDAFTESMQAAQDLGLTISDAGAAGVEAMNDALGRARASVDGLITQFTVQLAPAIEEAASAFTAIATESAATNVDMREITDTLVGLVGMSYDIGKNFKEAAEFAAFFMTLGQQGDLEVEMDFGFNSAEEWLVRIEERRKANAEAANKRAAERMEQERAAANAAMQAAANQVAAEEAKATSGQKTIEALERQLGILTQGREEYERIQQLASATTDEERAQIVMLQERIAGIEEYDEKIRKAREEQERLARQSTDTTAVTATEGRLITRGNAGNDQKKMLQAQEASLNELVRIREYLGEQTQQSSVELVVVGGTP